jgi:CheY-like chemotaxis protein
MKTIFFVEDNAGVVEVYRESLVREGFEVLVAEDGIAAMRLLREGSPDLVILDLLMPRLNGADVLKYIRTTPAHAQAKVVIFSNAYQSDIYDILLKAGKYAPDDFLLKLSCTPEKLVSVVKSLLNDGQTGENR